MENVWILGGLRSFIGVKDGIYRHIPAEVLGAQVLKEIKNRFLLKDEEIDYIIGGNAVAGGGNITRLAALTAGLDEMIPAVTLDLQCGSALESITAAAAKIESGLADLVIAGGFESSSTQPVRMWNSNHPDYQEGKSYTVAKFIPDIQGEQVMLEGAEKTALTENVTKAEMDSWVLLSHKRAAQAAKEGILSDIQLSIADSKKDEGIRPSMSQRLLDRLPCLLPGGSIITAANACLMHDGAAFVVLCSEAYRKKHGLTPQAAFRFGTAIGSDPFMSPKTAVLAIRKLLKQTALSIDAIHSLEVNEAYAVIDVLLEREFPGIRERLNPLGGALAYGHPYGASGAIILLHLLKDLELNQGRFGICGVAAAGGIGTTLLVEKVKRNVYCGDKIHGKDHQLSGTDTADPGYNPGKRGFLYNRQKSYIQPALCFGKRKAGNAKTGEKGIWGTERQKAASDHPDNLYFRPAGGISGLSGNRLDPGDPSCRCHSAGG